LTDAYEFTSDASKVDVSLVHRWLSEESYWAKGIPLAIVTRSIANSICFSILHPADGQVGFARVITDRASFAYLADVFVLTPHRGKGLSKRLMTFIQAHPDLQGLRRWLLATRDAHALYTQFGFVPPVPGRLLERVNPKVYEEF
jgi:GNAT superfamily N-acetyltransferase